MKVALVNSHDRTGGAARAAHRLLDGLRRIGVDARMLVRVKQGDEPWILGPDSTVGTVLAPLLPALDLLPVLRFPRRTKSTFYPGWLPDRVHRRIATLAPDLVHLHWIAGGTLNVRTLSRIGRPLVWTLHDMWPFTGGCHYNEDCGRYLQGCGHCPVLRSKSRFDPSRSGWRRKHRSYRGLNLHVVAPSRWLAESARGSTLVGGFPIRVVPNAIDTEKFRPIEKGLARQLLALPNNRLIVLFGALRAAAESRKGFRLLRPALGSLKERFGEPFTAVVFGASFADGDGDLGVQSIYVGTLSDDLSLALLYSAADVFVAPSTQENLSNTVMEALACGTPVVAFDIGGMPDMIEHRENGYLAQPFDPADLAQGLQWVLEDEQRRKALAARARAKVLEEFEASRVARRHLALYEEVLAEAEGAIGTASGASR